MRVVSNTSPISNLAIIARLDLLQRRYATIQIPKMVADELARLTHADAKDRINTALAAGWLKVDSTNLPVISLPVGLHSGEIAAISLAVALKADLLLIDEKRGRAAARHVRVAVGGVFGELLHAKLAGWLPALRPELERLRSEAGFFIDPGIEQFILSQAAE